ncbi:MAG: protein kinase [Kofleriaceae bacterium]
MTRYELLDRIGVGGMAEIFRGKAVAAGGFEKPVAIKRILPHLSQDKRFVELLIAEAKVLSLLKHRNIVQIFDVGLGDDGQYFLVMEYVDGKDLGAVQRGIEASRRRMPFDLALHIGAEICEALEHAHSARAPDGKQMSLVHRDVSPSNVLLSRAGEVKLTDFGIAKRAEQEPTGHGAVRGKFAYISPEQARNEHLDPRSDVFSVAVLLWELITNRRLFSGLGDLEALRAVREAKVHAPTEIDPRLGADIDNLLLAALARDPMRRPTAAQFGANLRSLRYSLDVTVGDPATELAKIIDNAERVERESGRTFAPVSMISDRFDVPENTESTVIRIRTAIAFSMKDKDGAGLAAAREVIDRFEEEETRLAQLSNDQIRMLREPRGSESRIADPPRRSRPATDDQPTRAHAPVPADNPQLTSDGRPRGRSSSTMRPSPAERTKPPTGAPLGRAAPDELPRVATPVPGTMDIRNPLAGLPVSLPAPNAPPPGILPGAPASAADANTLVPPQPLPPARNSYPVWNVEPQRPSAAFPAGYVPTTRTGRIDPASRPGRSTIKPWMLIVGALVMAGVAFLITRALMN